MSTQRFLRGMEPSSAELEGGRLPLYFSMRAAAMMEEQLDMDYPDIVAALFQLPDEDGFPAFPLRLNQQARVAACVIQEGQRISGEDAQSLEELEQELTLLHMSEWTRLVAAVTQEILYKSNKGTDSKNG